MDKLKKVGLSALAGSLASVAGANAGSIGGADGVLNACVATSSHQYKGRSADRWLSAELATRKPQP